MEWERDMVNKQEEKKWHHFKNNETVSFIQVYAHNFLKGLYKKNFFS